MKGITRKRLNSKKGSSGGGGGGGDIKSDGSVDFVAPETWDDGGSETVTISPDDITVTDGSLVIVLATSYGGIQVSTGANQTTIAPAVTSITDGTFSTILAPKVVVSNGIMLGIRTEVADYDVVDEDYTILCSTGGGDMVITLPDPTRNTGRIINVKKTTADVNIVRVMPFTGEKIDGSGEVIISSQWVSYTFQSNGTDWFII